ncbi:L-threonine ammonia-lyase-like isoform X2 [Liolophura sinensis]
MDSEIANKVLQARGRIQGYVRKTPLERSPFLTNLISNGPQVYLKLESEQLTGSFKVRGAFNKLCLLQEQCEVREKGALSASTGNHALACTVAMKTLGIPVQIYTPETMTSAKKETLEAYDADLVFHGKDCVEAETKARQAAKELGVPFISPYNDIDVAAGQGTIGVEIYEDLKEVDAVLVAVGGGGLIGGIAAYLKHINPRIQIFGCQPELSKVMYESVKSGRVIFEESGDTLSDGTAGGIEENTVTFDICKEHVDQWILVNEESIARAIYFVIQKHHKVIEGAAGVAVAAYLNNLHMFSMFKNVVIVICGANISIDKLTDILIKYK